MEKYPKNFLPCKHCKSQKRKKIHLMNKCRSIKELFIISHLLLVPFLFCDIKYFFKFPEGGVRIMSITMTTEYGTNTVSYFTSMFHVGNIAGWRRRPVMIFMIACSSRLSVIFLMVVPRSKQSPSKNIRFTIAPGKDAVEMGKVTTPSIQKKSLLSREKAAPNHKKSSP